MRHKVAIVALFSRDWAVDACMKAIKPNAKWNKGVYFLAIIDGGDKDIAGKVSKHLNHSGLFKDINIAVNPFGAVSELSITRRRIRITELKNQSRLELRKMVKNYHWNIDYVWSIEDDSIVNPNTLERLLEPITKERYDEVHPDVGIVSGVQVGRWHEPYIGAWKISEDRKTISTIPYSKDDMNDLSDGYDPVHATGMYCYVTHYKLYDKLPIHWQGEKWGADVNFGLDVWYRGFLNYVDWNSCIGHNVKTKVIYPAPDAPIISFEYKDRRESEEV